MKLILEAGDVFDIVATNAADQLIRVVDGGKLYVSLNQIERAVRDIVRKELQAQSLMDEEKR